MRFSCATFFAAIIPIVSAHGRIVNITTSSGAVYTGWDPAIASESPPITAWSASNLGNIYVVPSRFNTSEITCHYNANPGALHVNATAGDTLKLQWNEWPLSHKGPVLTYLAACNRSCASVDKTALEWVKIDQLGWLNSSGWEDLGGTWASDVLRANGAAWTAKIPESLAEGHYVLRHEIIALHVANDLDGAQAYPQCINLKVNRNVGGNSELKNIEGGIKGSNLYKINDSGILVDIHAKISGYTIPGPEVWQYASKFQQPHQKRRAW